MKVDSFKLALAGAIVAALVEGMVGYFGVDVGTLSQIPDVVTSAIALAAAILATKTYGISLTRRFSSSWFLFTLGMGFRLAGELGFQIDATVYNIPVPYPSLEDVLSLVGFAMIFLGLFLYVRMFAKSLTRAKALGIVTVVFLATAGGYAALLGPNIVTQAPELASASLTFAFAILEVLALSTALIGFAMLSGGRVGRSWLGLIGATLLTMVSDMLFFYIFVNAATNLLAADSLLSSWAYILFALAFQLHREEFA